MKKIALTFSIGGTYSDGKSGVRRIDTIDNSQADPVVIYTILSAKQRQEYDWQKQKMIDLIGSQSKCLMASFKTWAKAQIPDDFVTFTLACLEAKTVKLTHNERQVLQALTEPLTESDKQSAERGVEMLPVRIDTSSFAKRTLQGLINKGLLSADGQSVLLLGVAASQL